MKISLYVNQEKSHEWGFTLSESFLFSYIISCFGDYYTEIEKIDGKNFAWISKNKVIKQLPLLTDKVDTVYNLYKSLEKKGVIIYTKKNNKDLIALTQKTATWNLVRDSDLNPSDDNNSDSNPNGLGNKSEKVSESSDSNPTYKKVSLLESSVLESGTLLSPSNFMPSDLELYTNGTKEPSLSKPSLPPMPPIAKNGNLSKMRLGVKKVLSKMEDFDELVNSRDLSITDIMNEFSEYWIVGCGRDFNPQNFKGLQSSFRKWIGFSGNDKLQEKESYNALSNTSKLEFLLGNIKGKTKTFSASQRQDLNDFIENFEESSILEIAKGYSKGSVDGYDALIIFMQSQSRIDGLAKNR